MVMCGSKNGYLKGINVFKGPRTSNMITILGLVVVNIIGGGICVTI